MLSARATRGLELALFAGLVSPLVLEWYETTHASSRLSYALLVPALALVLALRARGAPESASPAAPARGAAVAALAAFLAALALVAGALGGVFTLSLVALPLAALAFAARAAPRRLAALAPALALLFLMVPPPMPVMDRVNPFLVQASGATAVAMLTPFDPAVGWAGDTLSFRGWQLIVAEACSGSGTFLMLGVLCAFLAALFRLRARNAAFLVALALPLTLLVNGARIASSALVIARFGAAAGEGLAHELLGQVVVIAGAALLVVAVERASARRGAPAGVAR